MVEVVNVGVNVSVFRRYRLRRLEANGSSGHNARAAGTVNLK